MTDKTDIVWRLRANWSYLGREAADEITRLRNKVDQLQSEVADAKKWAMQERSQRWALPDPLTDAERVSVKWAAQMIDDSREYKWHAATLRGLLERTK